MLETGYKSTFEHLTFRQLKGAYYCGLVCVPHDYPDLQSALDNTEGEKIFMFRPGKVSDSTEFKDFTPEGDTVFVLGSPQQDLVTFVGNDKALHITTAGEADMMAVCVAGIILYVHG